MDPALRRLGWVYAVTGGVGLLLGVPLVLLMAASPSGEATLRWFGPIFLMAAATWLAPSAYAGWGLLKGAWWSRTIAAAASVAMLVSFPLGFVQGSYGLWVLHLRRGAKQDSAAVRAHRLGAWLRFGSAAVVAMLILGAIVGLGWTFRHYLEPAPQPLDTVPAYVPPPRISQ